MPAFRQVFEAGRLDFQAGQGLVRPTPGSRGVGLAFWNPRAFWDFYRFNLLLCFHFNFFHLMRC